LSGQDFFLPPSNNGLGRPQTHAGTLSVARKAKVKLARCRIRRRDAIYGFRVVRPGWDDACSAHG